jgi:protein-L-isoaspartate(D-aspartate) O-methyltransferase
MVFADIERRGVRDAYVLEAMRLVPREAFVDPGYASCAYDDRPLPIGEGQTISQPYIVARMIEAAQITPESRVLEVGAGSGYAAAVLSRIASEVFAIERHARLAELARERIGRLGYDNVLLRIDDGTRGWSEEAPFDAILVAASGPSVPEPLKQQLAIGGRLVMPVGEPGGWQVLQRLRRTSDELYEYQKLDAVAFVPLIGRHGWAEDGAS